VLLAVTDGEDNESNRSLEQAIRAVQDDNGPVVYTIASWAKEGRERRAKRALTELSSQTGGMAFFPKNLSEVDEVSQAVATYPQSIYDRLQTSNSAEQRRIPPHQSHRPHRRFP